MSKPGCRAHAFARSSSCGIAFVKNRKRNRFRCRNAGPKLAPLYYFTKPWDSFRPRNAGLEMGPHSGTQKHKMLLDVYQFRFHASSAHIRYARTELTAWAHRELGSHLKQTSYATRRTQSRPTQPNRDQRYKAAACYLYGTVSLATQVGGGP